MGQSGNHDATGSARRPLRFIIIGAGMSGILAAIKLREAGFTDIAIFEKAQCLGGTWRDNTYPGVGCDVPSHLYSYSFAPNSQWQRRYASGTEILAYLQGVARRYAVEQLIRFAEEVIRCEFVSGRWQIETRGGHWDVADVVICATGITHHPRMPDIARLRTFAGAAFHSACWNHQVALDDRRIGIVGTGSSAAQLVSALSGRAARLVLFQRTASWVWPTENPAYSDEEKAQFDADPRVMQGMRNEIARRFIATLSDAVIDVDSAQLRALEAACVANLDTQVRDAQLREKLRPDYRVACKRLVVSPDFYQAIQRPNAALVTQDIECVEPRGVRTRDGALHELDVLVLATGFHTDYFMRPTEVVGRGGRRLDVAWAQGPVAYLSVAIPGFPNFFMLNGPNGPVGNFSLIDVAELQMAYILQLLELLRQGRCREISPTHGATDEFEAQRVAATANTVWTTGCRSWYLDERGVPASWPWTYDKFRAVMRAPRLEAFELADAP